MAWNSSVFYDSPDIVDKRIVQFLVQTARQNIPEMCPFAKAESCHGQLIYR